MMSIEKLSRKFDINGSLGAGQSHFTDVVHGCLKQKACYTLVHITNQCCQNNHSAWHPGDYLHVSNVLCQGWSCSMPSLSL